MADKFLVGKEDNSDLIIESLQGVKKLSRPDAVDLMNYFAGLEKNPKALYYIVKELGKYRDKRSASVLIELLTNFKEKKEQYLKIKCSAANILGQLKDENSVIPLMYVMNDREEDYRLRLAAAESLGKLGNSQAVMPLIKIISDEEEKSVYLKESATKALGMLGDERAVDPLIDLLALQKNIIDKFTYLRERTVEALGRIKFNKDKRVEALKNVLGDKSPHVRASAIEALTEMEDSNVLDFIEPMIYDDNESVVKTAVYAIYNLEGEEYLAMLLNRDNLPAVCRQEIEEILEEEEDFDEESEE